MRIESATQVPRSGPALRLLTEIELLASGRLTAHLDRLVEALRPDALHALRVQFEGIAATGSRSGLPIALSTWGSDLMLTARTSDRIAQQTSRALHRADLLLSDCRRDAELARSWGLRLDAPRYVVPGNFGVDLGTFPEPDRDLCARLRVEHRPLVVYPRGMSGLLDYHGFMEAAQQLIARGVDASFVGVGLAPTFGRQVIPGRLVCTDTLDPHTMLSIAASSAVTVSPAFSDGIPNSILEGMAGGAIPVCGELASLQDLERHGAVLVWCRTGDPSSIASAIRCGLRLYQGTENQLRNRSVVADHYSTKVAAGCAHDAYERLVKVAVG